MPEPHDGTSATGVVAVVSATPDALTILRMTLEHAGFAVISALTGEVRDGIVDLDAIFRQHRPGVVLYEVAPPYEAEWRALERHRATKAAARCAFVITSTSQAHVSRLAAGDPQIVAVLGTPYELDDIVQAVRGAMRRDTPS
jgi:DNA-binding response OmpR family regulator